MFYRPNVTDSKYLLADYMEFQCLKNRDSISSGSLRFLMSASDDELDNEGVDSSDDRTMELLQEAMEECNDRVGRCNGRYPFFTDGGSLEIDQNVPSDIVEIYVFLLLTTRLNMKTQKVQAGKDATQLFERLSAEVAKEYFGLHAKSMVFGTSVAGGFREKVENLIKMLNLGISYKTPLGSTGRTKDGNLDIVVWIPFSDKKDGQCVAMGQCKTGDNWESMLSELNPRNFFGNFTTGCPYAPIIGMFFVTESFGNYKWEERSREGGILFDRTRIMEFLPEKIDDDLMDSISSWNNAAKPLLICDTK